MYAIILCAGNSRRFGANKLLTLLNKKPLFSYALDIACKISYKKKLNIIIVTQYPQIEACAQMLNESYSQNAPPSSADSKKFITVVHNPSPEEGIASSIRLGTQAAMDMACPKRGFSMMFMVADQPYLKRSSIERLIDSHCLLASLKDEPPDYAPDSFSILSESRPVISALCWGQNVGNPVIFTDYFARELLALEGDTGGKSIIRKYEKYCSNFILNKVFSEEEKELLDIDTANDIDMPEDERF